MRPVIRKSLSFLSVFLTVWIFLQFFLPLIAPFLLGLALALAAEPMVGFLNKRLHILRPISTGIGVSMTFGFLAMLLLLLCGFLARELRTLTGLLPGLEAAAGQSITGLQTWLLNMTSGTPESIRPILQEHVTSLFSGSAALVEQSGRYLLSRAGNLLSHVPDSALGISTAILSGYMISAKLPRIRRWLRRQIPRERLQRIRETAAQAKQLLHCWLTAQAKLMSVTFLLVLLGLILLRIPYALIWAVGITFVDAFPVLGTGTVLLPWSILCLLQQDTARAIGLAGIYLTVSLTRSILEPKFLGRHLGLDPLAALMALYAGYKIWGIGGMLLAPMLAVTATQILPERKRNGK